MDKLQKTIKKLEQDGYWTKDGHNANRNGVVLDSLGENEKFRWKKASRPDKGLGKFVKCKTLDGAIRWAEVSGYYINKKRRIYLIYTPVGRFTRSKGPLFEQKPKWRGKELDRMRNVADRFVQSGDLMASIVETYHNRKYESLIPKYYIFKKSPTFIRMMQEKLKKALEKHSVDEDFVIGMYKDLIDSAMNAEDHNAVFKSLREIEKIVSIARQSDIDEVGQLTGAADINKKQLLARKDKLLEQAEEVDYKESDSQEDNQQEEEEE